MISLLPHQSQFFASILMWPLLMSKNKVHKYDLATSYCFMGISHFEVICYKFFVYAFFEWVETSWRSSYLKQLPKVRKLHSLVRSGHQSLVQLPDGKWVKQILSLRPTSGLKFFPSSTLKIKTLNKNNSTYFDLDCELNN